MAVNDHHKYGLIVNPNDNKFDVRAYIHAEIHSGLKLATDMTVDRCNVTTPSACISNLMNYAFSETPVTAI